MMLGMVLTLLRENSELRQETFIKNNDQQANTKAVFRRQVIRCRDPEAGVETAGVLNVAVVSSRISHC